MSDVIIGIQARLGSARFPRKVLEELIPGDSMSTLVMATARAAGAACAWSRATSVVVLTGPAADNADLIAYCLDMGLPVQATDGIPECDVLGRYARWCGGARYVVRLTADCPLVPYGMVQMVLGALVLSGCEYATNVAPQERRVPDGYDVEAFTGALLLRASRQATNAYDREHVTPWMRRHARICVADEGCGDPAAKYSVDTPEDLERLRRSVADGSVTQNSAPTVRGPMREALA